MLEYQIIDDRQMVGLLGMKVPVRSLEALQEKVNQAITEGWTPLGGIATSTSMGTSLYAQAMVRETPDS